MWNSLTAKPNLNFKSRLRAASIHFSLSMVVAILAALLVFVVWYPYPYREISGGRELFLLVVAVDIVLGPLLTFSIWDLAKSRKKLRFDLVVVALLQLAGLAYGLLTVFVARPVYTVFEYDRFRVVHALDVPTELTSKALPALQSLPISGPRILGLREFKTSNEKMEMTLAALGGVALSARPELWIPYSDALPAVQKEAKPLSALMTRLPKDAAELSAAAKAIGRDPQGLVYLPMIGRKTFWTVLLDPINGQPLAFVPVDAF
jgi:hypothetical protein